MDSEADLVLGGGGIRAHCHIDSNKTGDRFVGIRCDSENAMVYFPIGYHLPDTDDRIRKDIVHLIHVLSEFTTKKDRVLAMNKFDVPQKVEFPINAYRSVIEYYISSGGRYYIETEQTYRTSTRGKKDIARTIKNQVPLIQQSGEVSSFIYTEFTVKVSAPNVTKLITQINRFCVYEAFEKLGWLYAADMPESPGPHPDIRTSISILNEKLCNTNDDRKRALFQAMKDMLEFMDEKTSDRQLYFGTEKFEHVWEKLVDRAFGEKDKDKFFPRTRWLLDHDELKEKRPLLPDTIMIYNCKYYVLDAKWYKYGLTKNPDHLPNASDINKQITYGEYVERFHGIKNESLFNAFIMPYNKDDNAFELKGTFGNIGEAVGDWRKNNKNYERIQGIVMDTRYLMYHYTGNTDDAKAELAACIEYVSERKSLD